MLCELCPSPATSVIMDLRETDPVADAQGRLWATFAREGDPHPLCDVHQRPHTVRYRNAPVPRIDDRWPITTRRFLEMGITDDPISMWKTAESAVFGTPVTMEAAS